MTTRQPTSAEIRQLLRVAGINPKQSLSQNFLVDTSHLTHILKAADLVPDDVVLEIGPGLGILTQQLAQRVDETGHLFAVELDDRLIPILRGQFAISEHVTIIHEDILSLHFGQLVLPNNLPITSYKVVANLPYNITNGVLRYFLESSHPPDLSVIMVQKEVAERICEEPGALSILAVSVQFFTKPELVHYVPASAFYPQPKVDSAILRLERLPEPAVPDADPKLFFRMVRAGFSQKRKQLLNSLSGGLQLPKPIIGAVMEEAGIDPKRRAQTLSLGEWGQLYHVLFAPDEEDDE
ncbi:MAG: 16S rRNA (adenine(1518)-N(6)/adenine(1519)-N(6))-dimethyltransferase RsmA [Chloroflexota bacterium]